MSSVRARTAGTPIISQLPAKISPNEIPTTASIPHWRRHCGACSRLDPQPKFSFTKRSFALRRSARLNGWSRAVPSGSKRSSWKGYCPSSEKVIALR